MFVLRDPSFGSVTTHLHGYSKLEFLFVFNNFHTGRTSSNAYEF